MLLLVLVSACGQSESERVASAVDGYLSALAVRDGPRACGFLTRDAQRLSYRLNRVHSGYDHPDEACASVVKKGFFPGYGLKRLRRARITGIHVNGDRAQAEADGFPVILEKVEGDWKLAVNGLGNQVGDSPPRREPG